MSEVQIHGHKSGYMSICKVTDCSAEGKNTHFAMLYNTTPDLWSYRLRHLLATCSHSMLMPSSSQGFLLCTAHAEPKCPLWVPFLLAPFLILKLIRKGDYQNIGFHALGIHVTLYFKYHSSLKIALTNFTISSQTQLIKECLIDY